MAAYGDHYARLAQIKAKVVPHSPRNQNIKPPEHKPANSPVALSQP